MKPAHIPRSWLCAFYLQPCPRRKETEKSGGSRPVCKKTGAERKVGGEQQKADAVQGLLNLSTISFDEGQETSTTQETSPTPLGHCNSDRCKAYFRVLEVECQSWRTENIELKEKLQNMCFEESSFINNNDKVKALTGLPSHTKLSALFTVIAPYLMKNSKLPVFQQFMLTLIRMKLCTQTALDQVDCS